VAVRHYFGQYEEGEVNPNAADPTTAESPAESEEAKAVEVDEPGTPDEPVKEATTDLKPESDQNDVATETMEVENAADPERTHPVDVDDVTATENPVNAEAILEETEKAEEATIDQGESKGDA
jgi:transcription termination/antitermination protein NusA